MTLNRRACLLWVATTPAALRAQTAWPDRPIRLVVPYTPGGGTDTVTRHIAERITQDTRWSFLVDNKPGANGNIGMDLVAKARPDGYTLAMGQTSNLAINPAAMSKVPFDPARDFVPVALAAEVPMVLVVPLLGKAAGDGLQQADALATRVATFRHRPDATGGGILPAKLFVLGERGKGDK